MKKEDQTEQGTHSLEDKEKVQELEDTKKIFSILVYLYIRVKNPISLYTNNQYTNLLTSPSTNKML